MPYSTIHWIKLEKRLLNDYRFYSMSEEAQLIYVKFLMLAAETNNKIPKNNGLIKSALRSKQSDNKIEECINEIKTNFPKFKENKGFYFFKEWGTRCNWIAKKELPRNSEGTPKDSVDKIRIDKNRIDYIIGAFIKAQDWEESIKNNPALLSEIYKRHTKPAKRIIIALNDDSLAVKAIEKMASTYKRKGLSWTLETVSKHLPELIKSDKDPFVLENPL